MAEGKNRVRRVLCIGGPKDGKWLDTEQGGHELRVLKPQRFDYRVLSREQVEGEEIQVPVPQFDVYFLDQVVLYGEGIWVGLHKETMDKMDMSPDRGWRSSHTILVLRAILQRDVATEMGL